VGRAIQPAAELQAASIFNTQNPDPQAASGVPLNDFWQQKGAPNTLIQENTILTPICGETPTVKSPLF
jgi:hypothetical protein